MSAVTKPDCAAGLTAIVLAHGEVTELKRTIESVAPLARETLVVDAGWLKQRLFPAESTRIVPVAWHDDFSAVRNAAVAEAKGDWIFWLEPGEELASDVAKAMGESLAGLNATTAYLATIETPPEAPDASGERFAEIRLVPRGAGLEYCGRVRESLRPAVQRSGLHLELTPWTLLRGPAVHDERRRQEQARLQSRLAALEIKSGRLDPRPLVASADALATLGDYARAVQHYYQALRLANRGSLEMLEAYYGLLAVFRGDESDCQQQLAVCLEALETYPFDAQLLTAMGSYLQRQNHLELACRSYQAAVEIGQVEPQVAHLTEVRAVAASSWSLLLQTKGEPARAMDVLSRAAERFPESRLLHRRRLELLVQLGDEAMAQDIASFVSPRGEAAETLRIAVRGACLAARGDWVSGLAYLRTAYDAGCHDPVCLRWLTVGLLTLDKVAAATEVLDRWRAVAPSDAEALRYWQELNKEFQPEGRAVTDRHLRVDRATDLLDRPTLPTSSSATRAVESSR